MAQGSRSTSPPHGLGSLAEHGRAVIESLTGKEVVSMVAAEHDGEGWRLTFEVVEVERVPTSTSLLACYDVRLDDSGDVKEFARTRRYVRAQPDPEDFA